MAERTAPSRRVALALVVTALLATGRAQSADERDGWALLESARDSLAAASPLAGEFTQTFTPVGFSSGDTETGRMALSLPHCARWDYVEPFPKIFLLCGRTAYAWNPGETSGRKYVVTDDEQEGLDLLRLNVSELRTRYQAATVQEVDGLRIDLTPQSPATIVANASIRISADGLRLLSISFEDREENRTLFELQELRPADASIDFSAPADIHWIED